MFKFLVGISLVSATLLASNLSMKSTDELLNMRGTLTTQQERTALHNELRVRERTMTQEQKRTFSKRPANAGQGRGMGRSNRNGQGRGMGQNRGGGAGRR